MTADFLLKTLKDYGTEILDQTNSIWPTRIRNNMNTSLDHL